MTISNIGSNQTEVCFSNGLRILVSYKTPVAAYHPSFGYLRCSGESKTTMRHIYRWVGGKNIGKVVSRQVISALLNPSLVQEESNRIPGDHNL